MRTNTYSAILALALVFLTSNYSCSAAAPRIAPEECDALAKNIDSTLDTPAMKASALEIMAPTCVGKGAFDVILGLQYLAVKDFDNLDHTVGRGLAAGSLLKANLKQLHAEVLLGRGRVEDAYAYGLQVARDYPQYVPVLGFLAEIDFKAQRWQAALSHMERSNKIAPSAPAFLASASALHQLDRHEECIRAVNLALQIEPQRISRAAGVVEAVFSLGVLKRSAEAADLVRRHIAANPRWMDNPSMVNAARALSVIK